MWLNKQLLYLYDILVATSITFGPKSSSLSQDLADPCDLGLCKGDVAMETLSCCDGLNGEVPAETRLFISTWSSEYTMKKES